MNRSSRVTQIVISIEYLPILHSYADLPFYVSKDRLVNLSPEHKKQIKTEVSPVAYQSQDQSCPKQFQKMRDKCQSNRIRNLQKLHINKILSKRSLGGRIRLVVYILFQPKIWTMEDRETQEKQLKVETPEDSYFKLIEAVGANGKYQFLIILLSYIISFQNGVISLGTPYYFAVAPYTNCPPPYEGITKCTAYACSLPEEQRAQYLQPQINELETLGTEFGDYHCQKSDIIESAKGIYFFGAIFGFLIGSPLSDNLGRKISLLVSLAMGVLGHLMVMLAPGLTVVEVGMFLVGFSIENCFNVMVMILSEVLENSRRQKITIIFQIFFPVGGIAVVLGFYLFKQWQVIFLTYCLIPMIGCFLFTWYFVQQTPQFLIKRYSVQQIRDSLKFMAKVNGRTATFNENEVVSFEALEKMKKEYEDQISKSQKQAFTYWDLFKFKSLRKMTICSCLLFFCINILYYAPLMLVDEFGFDFYLNGVLINLSDLLTYIFSYSMVTTLKRKKFNMLASAVSLACSFLLIFLHAKEICTEDCWTPRIVFELLVVFLMRVFVAFMFQLIFVYMTELYPVQVVGLGIGLGCIVGSIPDIFIPELINVLDRLNFPVMLLFCLMSVLNLVGSSMLEETRGRAPRDKVLEIQKGEAQMQGRGGGSGKDGIELVEQS